MAAPEGAAPKPPSRLEGASTSAKSKPPAGPITYLSKVRAARHPAFDRVVFEFTGVRPGFRVLYTSRPIRESGSGRVIPVTGGAVLEVRMAWARSARISGGTVVRTYKGPGRLRPGTPVVTEVVKSGDFEAQLSWAIGVEDRVPFRAFALADPSRLVVDVAHPSQ